MLSSVKNEINWAQPENSQIEKKESGSAIDFEDLMRKIEEHKASSKDLFTIVDAGAVLTFFIILDNSGGISYEEFQLLTTRLGFKFSEHRLKEIMAKVKLDNHSQELNPKGSNNITSLNLFVLQNLKLQSTILMINNQIKHSTCWGYPLSN